MKTLIDIPHLTGVKVLLRADFNVPMKNGVVVDDFRIRAALPTVDFLCSKGATVILVSHLEDNDGENLTLQPVADQLKKLGEPVTFIKDYKAAYSTIEAGSLEPGAGRVFLMENLRFFEGEKKNDPKFAKELASLADIYVNDAFPVCHREHASVVGVPKLLPSYAGLQLEKEVENLSRAFNPAHPFLFILGGAKFETKMPLLVKFLDIADQVFVGGALANDIFKAKGFEVGRSLVSKTVIDLSHITNNPKLLVPLDVINQEHASKTPDSLSATDEIMDDGPKTLAMLKEKVSAAKFILWNGPLGMYEGGFKRPTLELAKMIAEATSGEAGKNGGVTSIIGGGDTIAATEELKNQAKFTFVSTGGGAMLDFLAKGTLPGIEALEKSSE